LTRSVNWVRSLLRGASASFLLPRPTHRIIDARFLKVDILFVEDSEESRTPFAKMLRACGHRVVAAGSVGEALRFMSCLRFDALVSDLTLPDGSGLDLVAEIKRRQPLSKAIALTGWVNPEAREQGLRAGFDEYLTKPVDFYCLRALLHQPLVPGSTAITASSK
jgi:CheY-like chemotaxis protein